MRRFLIFCLAAAGVVAQQQLPQQRPANWPCTGARAVDPSYVEISEGTGGHLYLLDKPEVRQTGHLMAWHQTHRQTVFRSMGEMAKGTREFAFPIDSTIESLVLTVSLQCNDSISILDPASLEAAGDRVDFRSGRALRVAHPVPGPWKIRLTGRGLFFVTVDAISNLSVRSAGLAAGSADLLAVEPSRLTEGMRVRFVDSGANTLDTPAIESSSGSYVFVRVNPRDTKFRVAVEGADDRGWPYLRMQGPLTVIK